MSQYVRPGCLCPSRHRVLTSRWHAWAVNAPFWAHPLQLVGMSEILKYVFKSPWHAVCGDEGVALASGYSVRRGTVRWRPRRRRRVRYVFIEIERLEIGRCAEGPFS